mgnify:FL=1
MVWRDKNVIVIYRGTDYNVENGSMMMSINNGTEESGIVTTNGNNVCNLTDGKGDEKEMESEGILEGLGPRYEKWTGLRPIPIDGDLLPPEVPNYRPPFRLLPFGVRGRLSDAELTNLRRLARPIAPHFVLGTILYLYTHELFDLYEEVLIHKQKMKTSKSYIKHKF